MTDDLMIVFGSAWDIEGEPENVKALTLEKAT